MDISKVRIGRSYNYRTPRGTAGRGRVDDINQRADGPWVTLVDKTRNKTVTVRPGMLSSTSKPRDIPY